MHCRSFVFVVSVFCCQLVSLSVDWFLDHTVAQVCAVFVPSSSPCLIVELLSSTSQFTSLPVSSSPSSSCTSCCLSPSTSLMSWTTTTRTSAEELGLPDKNDSSTPSLCNNTTSHRDRQRERERETEDKERESEREKRRWKRREERRESLCGSICFNTGKLTRCRHNENWQTDCLFLIQCEVVLGRSSLVSLTCLVNSVSERDLSLPKHVKYDSNLITSWSDRANEWRYSYRFSGRLHELHDSCSCSFSFSGSFLELDNSYSYRFYSTGIRIVMVAPQTILSERSVVGKRVLWQLVGSHLVRNVLRW